MELEQGAAGVGERHDHHHRRQLTSEIASNSELSRTYREQTVEPRLKQLERVVERGIERGDLRPDTDVRLAHELLVGPVMYRLLYSGQPLDDGLAPRIVDAVMRAFAPSFA